MNVIYVIASCNQIYEKINLKYTLFIKKNEKTSLTSLKIHLHLVGTWNQDDY